MSEHRQRVTALVLAGFVAVSLVLVGFGTGFLALTETPRPVGHLRPVDLQPAIASATEVPIPETDPVNTDPLETALPTSTVIGTLTTLSENASLPPSTRAPTPKRTTTTPASTPPRTDGDHDQDD